MADPVPEDLTRRALDAIRRRYLADCALDSDRTHAAELAAEASPAVESLLAGSRLESSTEEALDHHEGFAMLTLLGRRAAELGVSPTAMWMLGWALAGGLEEAGVRLPAEVAAQLAAVCFEGYVARREETFEERAAREAAEAQPWVRLAPRCLGLFLRGSHEAERLEAIVDRFGRALLQEDAVACVVDLSGLEGADRERAAEVFGVRTTARMLGADCVFVAEPAWLDAAAQAGVDRAELRVAASFEEGLRLGLAAAGLEIRRIGKLGGPLRALLRPRER